MQSEPGQLAWLARAAAFESRSVAAGELPDPSLRIGLANLPVDSGSFSAEPMTQAQIGLRQAFPPGRSRSLSTREMHYQALEMSRSAEARARDVLSSLRLSWIDAVYQYRAHNLIASSRPLFADLVQITRSLYGVGRRDQQDVLQAELELSRLEDRLLEIDRQRARARADLGQWVGAAAGRPLPESLPEWADPPPIATLRERLVGHPILDATNARIAARETAVDLARQSYRPGWAVEVGYGYRDGRDADGDPRSDFFSVAVSVDLPLFTGNRQDQRVSAAISESAAAQAGRDEQLRRLDRALAVEYARWQDTSRRIALYETRILEQAEDQSRAALLAYQSDAGDFADVMRSAIALLDLRIDHLRLLTERAYSHVQLANLGGLSI
ncbi:MAG: TolC family protein [Pseudomonadales bacterium]|nr:TolC family protein [Pseudomonadales bacterium]